MGGAGAAFAVRPSRIHGNGLFATRPIPKGTLITFYDGSRIAWAAARTVADRSYLRSVAYGHEVIDGLRAPVTGRGAGSMVNHAARGASNAAFWVRHDVVWVKATAPIARGTEITVDYGRTYWAGGPPRAVKGRRCVGKGAA